MEKYVIDEKTLKGIADAIRDKNGTAEAIRAESFEQEIKNIADPSVYRNTLVQTVERRGSVLSVPDGITSIGPYAFCYYLSLAEVTLPEGLKSIGYRAFRECSNLTQVKIPGTVVNLGHEAFYNCPKCLLFDFSECKSVPQLGNLGFQAINSNARIVVPEELLLTWGNAANWSTYKNHITTHDNAFFVLGSYIAKEGMTWREWIESDYNTDGFVINGDRINDSTFMELQVERDDWCPVLPDDIIEKGKTYCFT